LNQALFDFIIHPKDFGKVLSRGSSKHIHRIILKTLTGQILLSDNMVR